MRKRLLPFKWYLPEYNDYKLYWFVWWRVLARGVLDYARKKWLYVLSQNSKGQAKIVNNLEVQYL